MRNQINRFIHNDKVYFLPAIVLLVGMIGNFPDIASSQMEKYFLE